MKMEKGEAAFDVASYGHAWDRKEYKSEVENTSTTDCFLNAFSPDQIGKSNLNANAKYSTSFGCGASFKSIAFSATSDQSSSGISSISFSNSFGILITNSAISTTANNIGNAYIKHFLSEERTCAKKENKKKKNEGEEIKMEEEGEKEKKNGGNKRGNRSKK